ncbi:hypothetical protein ACE41F_26835 [Bacillus cereus]|uniref:hypothetical protein n=1 Tax=Bacillus cereus TaxID=1396 RepID=UPI0035CC79E8
MHKLTKKEIKEKTNEELVVSLLWNTVRSTHEHNSRRGLTKQTEKEEGWLMAEVAERFGLDLEVLKEGMDK